MIEQIEEIAQRMIALPDALRDELGVLERENALRTREPEKVDHESRRVALTGLERLDLAGREGGAWRRAEPDRLVVGIPVSPNAPAIRVKLVEQPHGLKELERIRFPFECLLDGAEAYPRVERADLPRGGSRLRTARLRLRQWRFGEVWLAHSDLAHTRLFHPARGGQVRMTSLRLVERATSVVKLLTDAYIPKNRSSTLANR